MNAIATLPPTGCSFLEDEATRFDLSAVGTADVGHMADAGARILECYRVLRRGGLNIVGEVLRDGGRFYEFEHYPKEDVFDDDSHAQYYYHAHRPEAGEHGHFHTFIRQPGLPPGMMPVPHAADSEWPKGDQALTHVIAISMDAYGFPTGLFTTNRWVTGEAWYRAEDVIAILDRFRIDHAFPSWPVNIWLSNLLVLFRPQIEWLLLKRDETVARWSEDHPDTEDVFEDRNLEITSALSIDVEAQIRAVMDVLGD